MNGTIESNGDSGGCEISADGNLVVFDSAASNLIASDLHFVRDIFLYDRVARSVSLHGRFVLCSSIATNTVGGDTNGKSDIFMRDRHTEEALRSIQLDPDGDERCPIEIACHDARTW